MGLGCPLLLLFPHQIGGRGGKPCFGFTLYQVQGWDRALEGTVRIVELLLQVLLQQYSYAFLGKTGTCVINSSHGECQNTFKPGE